MEETNITLLSKYGLTNLLYKSNIFFVFVLIFVKMKE
jgi:hypothetical protein